MDLVPSALSSISLISCSRALVTVKLPVAELEDVADDLGWRSRAHSPRAGGRHEGDPDTGFAIRDIQGSLIRPGIHRMASGGRRIHLVFDRSL